MNTLKQDANAAKYLLTHKEIDLCRHIAYLLQGSTIKPIRIGFVIDSLNKAHLYEIQRCETTH